MTADSTNKPNHDSAENHQDSVPAIIAPAWREWKRRWRDPITLFTFLMVIVGILQWFTLWTTDDTLKRTMIVGQRAFVVPSGGQIYMSPNADRDPQAVNFPFILTNNGNTATKNLKASIKCAPSAEDFAEPWIIFVREKTPAQPLVIGPKGTASIGCNFPFAQMEDISKGKLYGFIMLEASYEDRLEPGVLRLTQTSVRLTQVSITRPQEIKGTMVPAQAVMLLEHRGAHNCADEECPDYKK